VGVAVFGGLPTSRAAGRLSYFTSGIAFPDWTILSTEVLVRGTKGVEAAGYFGNDWGFDAGQAAFAEP